MNFNLLPPRGLLFDVLKGDFLLKGMGLTPDLGMRPPPELVSMELGGNSWY